MKDRGWEMEISSDPFPMIIKERDSLEPHPVHTHFCSMWKNRRWSSFSRLYVFKNGQLCMGGEYLI